MNKLFKLIAIVALSLPVLISCSGNKTSNDNGTDEQQTEATPEQVTKLDLIRLDELTKTDDEDITEDDYDFILDQIELIAKMSEGKTKEEQQAFYKTLSKDEQGAVVVLALMSAAIENSDKAPDNVKKRLAKLKERYDKE